MKYILLISILLMLTSIVPMSSSVPNISNAEYILIDDTDDYKQLGIDITRIEDLRVYTPQVLVTGHLPFIIKDTSLTNDILSSSALDKLLTSSQTKQRNIDFSYQILVNETYYRREKIVEEELVEVDQGINKNGTAPKPIYELRKVINGYKEVEDYHYVWRDIDSLSSHYIEKDFLVLDIVGKTTATLNHWNTDIIPKVEVNNEKIDLKQWAWWNSAWDHYRTISIDDAFIDATLHDFPVCINITDAIGDECQANGEDIRFVGIDNTTEYYYEIEKWVDGSDRIVWVNVTSVSSNAYTTILMYYGNAAAADDQHPADVWDGHYLLVLHMNDAAGGVTDSTSNSNDGAEVGTPVYHQSGQAGYCVQLDGSTEYFNFGDVCDLDTNLYTLEHWFNMPALDTKYRFVFVKQDGTSGWHSCSVRPAAQPQDFYSVADDGPDTIVVYSADATGLGDNNWHYAVNKRYDLTHLIMQIDVTAVSVTGANAGLGNVDTGASLYLGALGSSPDYYFPGYLDEIRISDVNRNSSWIWATYNTTKQTPGFLIWGDEQVNPVYYANPVISGLYPANNSIDICPCCEAIGANITQADGLGMNISIFYNCSGLEFYDEIGEAYINGTNGSYYLCICSFYFNTNYTWWIRASVYGHDSNYTISPIYELTTMANPRSCVCLNSTEYNALGGGLSYAWIVGIVMLFSSFGIYVFIRRRKRK